MKTGIAIAFIIGSLLVSGVFSILLAQANFKPAPLPHTYIQSDGSINPSSAPISRKGNVYTLTGDLNGTVLDIRRSNAIVDSGGFSIPGFGYDEAILLTGVTNVTVTNFTINGRNVAMHLNASSYCTITGNSIIDASYGIWLTDQSNGNAISGNSITSCYYGVYFDHSRNNVLRNNSIIGDDPSLPSSYGQNFAVIGDVLEDFINDVDASNSVNGKTVYYWVNMQNTEVPSNAGCIMLVNCTNITVQNQHLLQNKYGVLLAGTNASTVRGNSIESNAVGIYLFQSSFNTIANNSVFNSRMGDNEGHGIRIQSSYNNVISGNNADYNHAAGIYVSQSPGTSLLDNNITRNRRTGITIINESNQFVMLRNLLSDNDGHTLRVADCTGGTIVGNKITKNRHYCALYLTGLLQGNSIYGNSFDGVKVKEGYGAYYALVSATTVNPTWDNCTIGNYWSDYLTLYPNASEIESSSIGDMPYVIKYDNIDHFPLIAPLEQPQEGDNKENNDGLLSAGYLVLAVVSVVIVVVAVTAIVLRRNAQMQRTSAPTC
jgi:parallel beta-helix repeat protein